MSANLGAVNWREWNEESFAAAREQDKPILLDIGAVWCHWCHVMDEGIPGDPIHTGTYSNEEVAELIEARYIPIKVDNDRRPDINARYNQGGWPSTVFLTPSGHTIYGETYVEPKRMKGLLHHIADYYRDNKAEIAENAAGRMGFQPSPEAVADSPSTAVADDIPLRVAAAIKSNFDAAYGGFGSQPKFPHPEAIIFAVEEWRRRGDEALREIATLTLTAMAGGGMYDRFAGGFFRYSTTRNWSIPHYEKMTQDNSRLSMACLLAGAAFGDSRFTDIAIDVHNFMFTVMRDADTGCFAGSQDADQEERYYGLPLEERSKLPTPSIDWTTYADWNAMMVSSLVLRYKLVGPEPEILTAAEQAYAFVVNNVSPYHFLADAAPGGESDMLTDLTCLVEASSALYEVTGRAAYLADAHRFADTILARLTDASGGFYDIQPNASAIGELALPHVDIIQSADAALALTRLTALGGDQRYREAAVLAVARFAASYHRHSFMAGGYGRAAAAVLADSAKVIVAGDGPAAQEMQRAAWAFDPTGIVALRTPEDAVGDYPVGPDGAPAAYVCVGSVCHPPAATAADLTASLRSLT